MTKLKQALWSAAGMLMGAALLSMVPIAGHAQDRSSGAVGTIQAADPTQQGDGTMGSAAAAAKNRGALPFSAATAQRKAAADRAHAEAMRSGALRPASPSELAPANGIPASPKTPAIVCPPPGPSCLNFAGQSGGSAATNVSPPGTAGAIGPTRYIQAVNTNVRIYDRTGTGTPVLVGSGTLNKLADNSSTVTSRDPQVIWDATTNRFYYVMNSHFSATDNKLAFGFSKTDSPSSKTDSPSDFTTHWCHYYFNYGARFPDYPRLGDNYSFIIIGVNGYKSSTNTIPANYLGSDIVAISKPAAGTTCPAASKFKIGIKQDLRDTSTSKKRVFTPVPANQIDDNSTGYVVAISGDLPSSYLWFFNVTRNSSTGLPVFGSARAVAVASYDIPPSATQPADTRLLDTLDARNTQAVQAINPARGTKQSFWTQHTVANGIGSGVRWYEINPHPDTPVVLRGGTITAPNSFLFNAAISPDRKKNESTPKGCLEPCFGNSFVIHYNVSSKLNNINPRIIAGSSRNGATLTYLSIRPGVGPYRDFTCPSPGDICRWGDYAAATPDPNPPSTVTDRGVVWGTNQFSGVTSPNTADANWRTRIFAVQP